MALKNISVEEFKKVENTSEIQIVRNPNTSKLFAAAGNGKNYKVQGDLDVQKPINFLYDTEKGVEDGCFVNQGTDNVLATL